MFVIIWGHSYLSSLGTPIHNFSNLGPKMMKWYFPFITNAFFAVDVFFLVSGFLTFYIMISKMRKVKVWMIFMFWYFRLLPLLVFITLFSVFVFPFIVNGATFDYWTTKTNEKCPLYWWTGFIFINNVYPWNFADHCIGWPWYLANDM